jgi:hypothetical protein
VSYVQKMRTQPVAARSVAEALADSTFEEWLDTDDAALNVTAAH